MDSDFYPPDILYWPWAVVIGWPIAFVTWYLGRKKAHSHITRSALSLLIACAITPNIASYGGRSAAVYALLLAPRLFGASSIERFNALVGMSPIVLVAFCIFFIWTIQTAIRAKKAHVVPA